MLPAKWAAAICDISPKFCTMKGGVKVWAVGCVGVEKAGLDENGGQASEGRDCEVRCFCSGIGGG